jgi:hypothetical protein
MFHLCFQLIDGRKNMGSKKMGECSSTIKFNPKISLQDDERKGQSQK